MNIGFHIIRTPVMKLYGPIIEHLLNAGLRVTIFCDQRVSPMKLGKKKSYQFPAEDEIPVFKGPVEVLAFRSDEELARLVRERDVRAVFFINFSDGNLCRYLKESLGAQRYEFISVELQYFHELFMNGKDLTYTDVIYTMSDAWKEWWKEYIQDPRLGNDPGSTKLHEIDEKCVSVGFPEGDQVEGFDALEIREKYDIPKENRVVLFFPFPWFLPFDVWTHLFFQKEIRGKLTSLCSPKKEFLSKLFSLRRKWPSNDDSKGGGVDDLTVTTVIRDFCDRNDAFFVVKGRKKNRIPRYLKRMADRLFFDEGFYPFTTLELLHIAELSISFFSGAILESAMVRTPGICLAPKGGGYWPGYEEQSRMSAFSLKKGSFYNFEGVISHQAVDHFIRTFPQQSFDDFSLDLRYAEEFAEKYLGFNDHQASRRICEDLLKRLNALEDRGTNFPRAGEYDRAVASS